MKEADRVRKAGVHHGELSTQESAYSPSLTDQDDGCVLMCASDQIRRQL
jgi:hypothetical protein